MVSGQWSGSPVPTFGGIQTFSERVADGQKDRGILVGALPYLAGALLVMVTRNVLLLAILGALTTLACTMGAYRIRRSTDRQHAKHMLIADPFLYGFEFAFTAVLVRYAFVEPLTKLVH